MRTTTNLRLYKLFLLQQYSQSPSMILDCLVWPLDGRTTGCFQMLYRRQRRLRLFGRVRGSLFEFFETHAFK